MGDGYFNLHSVKTEIRISEPMDVVDKLKLYLITQWWRILITGVITLINY